MQAFFKESRPIRQNDGYECYFFLIILIQKISDQFYVDEVYNIHNIGMKF